MMKTSLQINLAVQIGAGLYALHKGEALAVFLAASTATATYLAWHEEQVENAKPNATVLKYIEKIQKGLV